MRQLTEADRDQITEVVRRADELATSRDVDGYIALTTPDMALEGAEGNAYGREAVRAAIASIWAAEPRGTRHLTGDISITPGPDALPESGPTALTHSTLQLVSGDSSATGTGPVASIDQLLRRTEGRWLIGRRTVRAPGSSH